MTPEIDTLLAQVEKYLEREPLGLSDADVKKGFRLLIETVRELVDEIRRLRGERKEVGAIMNNDKMKLRIETTADNGRTWEKHRGTYKERINARIGATKKTRMTGRWWRIVNVETGAVVDQGMWARAFVFEPRLLNHDAT